MSVTIDSWSSKQEETGLSSISIICGFDKVNESICFSESTDQSRILQSTLVVSSLVPAKWIVTAKWAEIERKSKLGGVWLNFTEIKQNGEDRAKWTKNYQSG